MKLEGRVAIVSGAASGIARATAIQFAREGAVVMAVDRDEEGVEETVAMINLAGGQAEFSIVDVSKSAEVQAAVRSTLDRFGDLHILFNGAGILAYGTVLETTEDAWDRMMAINLKGAFLCTRAASKVMAKQRYGRIINIASIVGQMGNAGQANYCASKAGLIGLTKSLAKELATKGILVNCVTPAAANTELFLQMTQEHIDYMRSKIPMNRFVEPHEIAATVCWLASEDCSFSTGAVFDISGGRATY